MSLAAELLRVERELVEARARDPARDFPALESRRAALYMRVYVDEVERARYADLLAREPRV